jgi:hypothetical protein
VDLQRCCPVTALAFTTTVRVSMQSNHRQSIAAGVKAMEATQLLASQSKRSVPRDIAIRSLTDLRDPSLAQHVHSPQEFVHDPMLFSDSKKEDKYSERNVRIQARACKWPRVDWRAWRQCVV